MPLSSAWETNYTTLLLKASRSVQQGLKPSAQAHLHASGGRYFAELPQGTRIRCMRVSGLGFRGLGFKGLSV